MTKIEIVLVVILILIEIVGLSFIKKKSEPVINEPPKSYLELPEYQLAQKLVNSEFKINCYQFSILWKILFPDKECYKIKTPTGNHYYCELVKEENLWIDANWKLDGKIRIFKQ